MQTLQVASPPPLSSAFSPDLFIAGAFFGALLFLVVRYVLRGFYTVGQNERAVKTIFGRAVRLEGRTSLDLPDAAALRPDERERYAYPQLVVIPPGGPYFKWPWETIYKVSVATEIASLALDPETPAANRGGTVLEAVTKDQLNTGLSGQIRFRVTEQNLYAYLFGVRAPIIHVMAYFVSILRQKIASFTARPDDALTTLGGDPIAALTVAEGGMVQGISINDLRKNLRDLNDSMDRECQSSAARYGVALDACLITGIDPPSDVDSALAAINTAHNHVSSEISLAQASADQRIVQSRRAVEIETLRAQAEVEPLRAMARELEVLRKRGPEVLAAYVRNARLAIYAKAKTIFMEVER